jgi:Major capsid protein N-terminus/Large eukaryotic DNA virus major capsid protein
MPSSALLQLVALGEPDLYLTSNPQFTYFRSVYRRYTNFAVESIPIDFDGATYFGKRISVEIPKKADLLSSLFIEVDLPPLPQADPDNPTYWVNDIAYALIKDVSIEIGEKEIDKHTGEWMKIWGDLTIDASQRQGYNEMLGHWDVYPPTGINSSQPLSVTIPLKFWFCNNIGSALPLICLQAHPIRIIIHLRPFQELWWNATVPAGPGQPCPAITPVQISRFQMFGDYIYLGTEERRRMASKEHEYLITQLQIAPVQSIPAGVQQMSIPLHFNLPCKEFIWVMQETRMKTAREWFNFSNALQYNGGESGVTTQDLLSTAILRLDGQDRFYIRNAVYFRQLQVLQHHTSVPESPSFVYLYSFSMRPEDEQPSGSINCSKINDIIMALTFNPDSTILSQTRTVQFYAVNYNVLYIVGGLGGIRYTV